MTYNMNEILASEYNMVGELVGLGALDGAGMQKLQQMEPLPRMQALKKLVGGIHQSRRSRAEFEKFFRQIPQHVKDGLITGSLRLADSLITATKKITSQTIKMFETQDDKETGVSNVSNAKLDKNVVFLVSGIYMLTGKSTAVNNPEANKAIDFKSISTVPALANGFFSLKARKRQIVPDNTPNRPFVTDNNHTGNLGYWKLDNPRMINDEELIEFVIELGTMQGVEDDQFIQVHLDGTGTAP